MNVFGSFLGTAVVQLPVLVVLVVGLVLLLGGSGRRLPRRSLVFARAGLFVLLAEAVAGLAWALFLPQILLGLGPLGDSARTLSYALAAVNLMLTVLTALGLGLLIAGLLAGRTPEPAPPYAPAPPPYDPSR